MNLKISINKAGVGSATTTYTIKEADMFISGTEIEGNQDGANTCYLAVFKSQVIATETWFVGNVFMRDYYVVYDMTPKDSRKLSYI